MNIKEFAYKVSHDLHTGQYRNDKVTPYTVHTDWVGDNSIKYIDTTNPFTLLIVGAVGHLHDVLEDCDITEEQLRDLGESHILWKHVVDNIKLLTRPDKTMNIIDYLSGIKQSLIATAVKLADLEHNLSDLKPGNLRDKYHLCQNFLQN